MGVQVEETTNNFLRPIPPGGQATRLDNALSGLLSRFAEEVASVRDWTPPAARGTS